MQIILMGLCISFREQMLKYYLEGKPVKDTVDVNLVAKQTKYFSGADIYSLINEAALIAVKND